METTYKETPQNIEAERALLGSIMLRPKAFIEIMSVVTHESFSETRHKFIFESMSKLFLNNKPIDLISMSEDIAKSDRMDFVGGASYLNEIANTVPSSTNVGYYARLVSENHKRRVLISIAQRIEELSYKKDSNLDSIISDTITDVSNIIQNEEDNTFGTAIEDVFKKAEEYKNNPNALFGISSGIKEVDHILDGFQDGQFIGFAAYTSQGKTWDAINIAVEQLNKGRKFCFFSLEMGASQIATRLASVITSIPIDFIRKGLLTDEQKEQVVKAMDKIRSSGSTIYGNQSLDNIKISILKESLTGKPDLFILDYLQLISSKGMSSYDTLTEASHYFQNALMKAKIPMFALSQISNESAKDNSLNLLPFKGSGDIGASLSTAIYKKSKHRTKKEVGERLRRGIPLESEWTIMKNRDGDEVGTVTVWFDNKTKRNMGKEKFDREYGLERYYKEVEEMNRDIKEDEIDF